MYILVFRRKPEDAYVFSSKNPKTRVCVHIYPCVFAECDAMLGMRFFRVFRVVLCCFPHKKTPETKTHVYVCCFQNKGSSKNSYVYIFLSIQGNAMTHLRK
jgi:hypothetical protein